MKKGSKLLFVTATSCFLASCVSTTETVKTKVQTPDEATDKATGVANARETLHPVMKLYKDKEAHDNPVMFHFVKRQNPHQRAMLYGEKGKMYDYDINEMWGKPGGTDGWNPRIDNGEKDPEQGYVSVSQQGTGSYSKDSANGTRWVYIPFKVQLSIPAKSEDTTAYLTFKMSAHIEWTTLVGYPRDMGMQLYYFGHSEDGKESQKKHPEKFDVECKDTFGNTDLRKTYSIETKATTHDMSTGSFTVDCGKVKGYHAVRQVEYYFACVFSACGTTGDPASAVEKSALRNCRCEIIDSSTTRFNFYLKYQNYNYGFTTLKDAIAAFNLANPVDQAELSIDYPDGQTYTVNEPLKISGSGKITTGGKNVNISLSNPDDKTAPLTIIPNIAYPIQNVVFDNCQFTFANSKTSNILIQNQESSIKQVYVDFDNSIINNNTIKDSVFKVGVSCTLEIEGSAINFNHSIKKENFKSYVTLDTGAIFKSRSCVFEDTSVIQDGNQIYTVDASASSTIVYFCGGSEAKDKKQTQTLKVLGASNKSTRVFGSDAQYYGDPYVSEVKIDVILAENQKFNSGEVIVHNADDTVVETKEKTTRHYYDSFISSSIDENSFLKYYGPEANVVAAPKTSKLVLKYLDEATGVDISGKAFESETVISNETNGKGFDLFLKANDGYQTPHEIEEIVIKVRGRTSPIVIKPTEGWFTYEPTSGYLHIDDTIMVGEEIIIVNKHPNPIKRNINVVSKHAINKQYHWVDEGSTQIQKADPDIETNTQIVITPVGNYRVPEAALATNPKYVSLRYSDPACPEEERQLTAGKDFTYEVDNTNNQAIIYLKVKDGITGTKPKSAVKYNINVVINCPGQNTRVDYSKCTATRVTCPTDVRAGDNLVATFMANNSIEGQEFTNILNPKAKVYYVKDGNEVLLTQDQDFIFELSSTHLVGVLKVFSFAISAETLFIEVTNIAVEPTSITYKSEGEEPHVDKFDILEVATIKTPEELGFAKTDKTFICWIDELGNQYFAGEKTILSENVVLTAKWETTFKDALNAFVKEYVDVEVAEEAIPEHYAKAKAAFNELDYNYRVLFYSQSSYKKAFNTMNRWAKICGEHFNARTNVFEA